MKEHRTILVAGGTGLIGRKLVDKLKERGHSVAVLTRFPKSAGEFKWSPSEKMIDEESLKGVDTIINLAGAGIADKRWTEKRKKELIDSRVNTTKFLYKLRDKIPELNQYISASGINCYGYDQPERKHPETDDYGTDFLSVVVKRWEEAADLFASDYKVAKIRTGVVLDSNGGAMEKIAKTVKSFVGAPLGTGKQWMPWLTNDDMVNIYVYAVEHSLEGAYNALANAHTNKEFTKALAKYHKKPLWLPNVPAFVLKIALGEMATVVLDGLQASNTRLKDSGFEFEHKELEKAIASVYESK